MNKILPSLLVFFFSFQSMLFAQSSTTGQQKSKYVIYTFTVSGVKNTADANKLDNFLKSRKGIISSTTDVQKKTVEVKAESYIDYKGVIAAVKSQGFEASEQHKTKNSDN